MIRPLGDNVLIKPEPRPTQYSSVGVLPGSLYHPAGYDGQLRPFFVGRIQAVGAGRPSKRGVRLWPDVLPGDRVVFVGGVDFVTDEDVNAEVDGLLLVSEQNIVAVVEG
jgi:co-chaperonin GroES (HSP10)